MKSKSRIVFTYKNILVVLAGLAVVFLMMPAATTAKLVSWFHPHKIQTTVAAPKPAKAASSEVTLPEPEPEVANLEQQAPQQIPANGMKVLVLMYHHVGDLTSQQRATDPVGSDLTVSPADFEAQVSYLRNQGYQSVSVAQLYAALENGTNLPGKPLVFTFDDGYKDVFVNAIPILQKYGYTGSFAIPTELLGRPGYAVWDDVVAADKEGMEILSHTENHLDLTSAKYSEADLVREIFGSKNKLESELGHPVDFFVYPYGHVNYHVGELAAQAGYQLAFTTAYGMYMNPETPMAEPRVRVHGTDGLEKLKKLLEPGRRTAPAPTNP